MWQELTERLDTPSLDQLDQVLIGREVAANDVLFWEGQAGSTMSVIVTGHLLVERTTENGDTVAVAVLGPNSIVGEQALLSDETRGATARAITDCSIRSLGRAQFDALRAKHPIFNELLLGLLDTRIKELSDLIMEARHLPAEDRVKGRLREMHCLFGSEIPLTQATLAALAGTTRPTTNAVLRDLQSEGILELKRSRVLLAKPYEL